MFDDKLSLNGKFLINCFLCCENFFNHIRIRRLNVICRCTLFIQGLVIAIKVSLIYRFSLQRIEKSKFSVKMIPVGNLNF
jgi:hypothetical protein